MINTICLKRAPATTHSFLFQQYLARLNRTFKPPLSVSVCDCLQTRLVGCKTSNNVHAWDFLQRSKHPLSAPGAPAENRLIRCKIFFGWIQGLEFFTIGVYYFGRLRESKLAKMDFLLFMGNVQIKYLPGLMHSRHVAFLPDVSDRHRPASCLEFRVEFCKHYPFFECYFLGTNFSILNKKNLILTNAIFFFEGTFK